MELIFRGVCTRCGLVHSDRNHKCSDEDVELAEIDRKFGPRNVRINMLARGDKGFENCVEIAEARANELRLIKKNKN